MWRMLMPLMLVVGLVACQPLDPAATQSPDDDPGATGPRLGAPATGVPDDLAALLERGAQAAGEWQADARVSEAALALTPDGRAASAQLTYLAPDADRMLVQEFSDAGATQTRVTLATLSLQSIAADALAALPPFPSDAQPVEALVAAAQPALAQCGGAAPTRAVFRTGAPYAWDGERWTQELRWTVDVISTHGEGAAITLDPVTAAPTAPCTTLGG